jgi:hypothetical protein
MSELQWAFERVLKMQQMAEANAGVYGAKLLKGHGYPDEVMRDAQDALALRLVLAALHRTQLVEQVRAMRVKAGLIVERHAAIYARDVSIDIVRDICGALGDISVDEATAVLDRLQREARDEA